MGSPWVLPQDFVIAGKVCATCIWKRRYNTTNNSERIPAYCGASAEELGRRIDFQHGGSGERAYTHKAYALLPRHAIQLASRLGLPREDMAVMEALDAFRQGSSAAEGVEPSEQVPEGVSAEVYRESLQQVVKMAMQSPEENPFVILLDEACVCWITDSMVARMDNFREKISRYIQSGALTVGVDIQAAREPFIVSVDGLLRILMLDRSMTGNKARDYFILVKEEYNRVCDELRAREMEIARLQMGGANPEMDASLREEREAKRKAESELVECRYKLARIEEVSALKDNSKDKDLVCKDKDMEIEILKRDHKIEVCALSGTNP